MRKQELVHLHALAVELCTYVSALEQETTAEFDEYETSGATPLAIHSNKQVHKEAVQLLFVGAVRMTDAQPPSRDRTTTEPFTRNSERSPRHER